MAQLEKNPPAMRETWVWSLGWEDPPEEGKGYPLQSTGLENSMVYSPWGHKESDTTERLSQPMSHGWSWHNMTVSSSLSRGPWLCVTKGRGVNGRAAKPASHSGHTLARWLLSPTPSMLAWRPAASHPLKTLPLPSSPGSSLWFEFAHLPGTHLSGSY